MLKLDKVRKLLGGRAVLDGAELDCQPGELALIVGANGSGKSTLLRLIAGILEVDSGEIRISGHSLRHEPELAKASLGYAPDGMQALPDLRASELVALVRGLKSLPPRLPAAEQLWRERLGFSELAERRLHALSFGQRKRAMLVAAVAGAPPLLLLDEPSNGLDPSGVEALCGLIQQGLAEGTCYVITTNDGQLTRDLGGTRYRVAGGRVVRESL